MKKLAIGCGLAILITGIAAAGVAYYLYRQVSSTVAQFAELAQIPDLERTIRNKTTFTPPSSEELTEGQVQKLVQVQTAVRTRLGERMASFEAKYKTLLEKKEASLSDATAIIAAYRDLASTWMDAKRSQIEALNTANLSLDEYRWIREQSYRALGQPFVDLDFGKLMQDAQNGIESQAGALRGALEPGGPEANKQLVEKVKKVLTDNLALASFGL
jgi:hypothetical protein